MARVLIFRKAPRQIPLVRMLQCAVAAPSAGTSSANVIAVQEAGQDPSARDPFEFQALLTERSERVNLTISELRPKSAALKDPGERYEMEVQLEELARRGHLISEAKRELDMILAERSKSR